MKSQDLMYNGKLVQTQNKIETDICEHELTSIIFYSPPEHLFPKFREHKGG